MSDINSKIIPLDVFKNVSKHHLLLHLIVFIWGWSPILGKGIQTDAMQLVWYRIAMTILMMGFYLTYIKANILLSIKQLMQLSGIGLIICIHWLCFYGAIKISNVSVTMAAFSTGTLFTAIIEPLFFKRKVVLYEILIGLIIIGSIYLIFSVEIHYWMGIILGILAAFTASIFSVLNGVIIQNKTNSISSPVLSFIELTAALVGLTIFLAVQGNLNYNFFSISGDDTFLIFLLAAVCTVYPFIASVNLMKHLTPYTINLTVNLEGVYGIILAGIIFKENKELSLTFYLGFLLILFAIFLNAFLKQKLSKA